MTRSIAIIHLNPLYSKVFIRTGVAENNGCINWISLAEYLHIDLCSMEPREALIHGFNKSEVLLR